MYRAISFVIMVMVPVLLVLGSIRLLLSEPYLHLEYHKADFPADYYGFTLEDRLYYAPFAINYLLNGEDITYLGNLTLPGSNLAFYTERELHHMADVKTVVQAAMLVLAILGIAFIALAAVLSRSRQGRTTLYAGLMSGGVLTCTILVALVVYVLVDWSNFFTRFHNLFFAEGTWTFNYSDSLIRLFPIRFWQDAALTVGGLTGAASLLIIFATAWLARLEGRSYRASTQ